MTDTTSRSWEIFFEVFESLPRQGPGNRDCAAKALAFCRDMPPSPTVLDLGCGVGGQTLQLAELTAGTITAIDKRAKSIDRLAQLVSRRGLGHRIRPMVGDMANLNLPNESFDLVWSEGALYFIGITPALQLCHALLRPGGHMAFSDCVWKKENVPTDLRTAFEQDYPTMGMAADLLAKCEASGFEVLGHFTLPDAAWWDDFYTPMEQRIQELRFRYSGDNEALEALDQIAAEPDMYRQRSEWYGYEFIVAKKRR